VRRFDASLRAVAGWDEAWCLRFNHAAGIPWICALFRAASRLGDGVFWYALMAGLLVVGGPAAIPAVAHMAAVGAIGVLLYKWLKSRTSRPRPYQARTAIRRGADPLDNFSFPSGHTLHAASFSILAIAYFPPAAWLCLPFAALVAASRLVLGLHYPTDVLAGAAIGAALAFGSLALI
jgi:undecaprenyl-diphosphatase